MKNKKILITGGAGYVGSSLVPKLLKLGHEVIVFDLFMYGDVFFDIKSNPKLKLVKSDIRNLKDISNNIKGCDTVIHLACISNDPSFELNPELGKSINYDAFTPLVEISKENGVERFIYASSSSVYGVKNELDVTEDLCLEPLTDYSKYKALCEEILLKNKEKGFYPLIIRPATVCGYARRLRLDLTVNILTNHAINNGLIKVFGGSQKRPNINIEDMTDLYVNCINYPLDKIDCKIFNVGYENHSINEIARIVKNTLKKKIDIVHEKTDDLRSYHVSSKKIERELGFVPKRTINEAVESINQAFIQNIIPNSMIDSRYYNIKTMQNINLQ
ncbi:MAG: UDP-glucose 4-epimerase [Rhodospirillaceae bacterium]|nr:UDP-glucose 4-epimerase [Rhodospirillaceae bacterium]|tara:strand:- start:752 stop:1744 length:993 start_codon:yes stop_codon:yes gene_type:complete